MSYVVNRIKFLLVFENQEGKYAAVCFKRINNKFSIQLGNKYDLTQFCGDSYHEDLSLIEVTSSVANGLGIDHNEDIWCGIYNHIEGYQSKKLSKHS